MKMQMTLLLLDIAMTFLQVIEKEGIMLKRAVMNMGWALAFVCVASFLILTAAGFFLAGIYNYLAARMSIAAALLIVAIAALVLALIFAGVAKRLTIVTK